jgi:hypothetical protein
LVRQPRRPPRLVTTSSGTPHQVRAASPRRRRTQQLPRRPDTSGIGPNPGNPAGPLRPGLPRPRPPHNERDLEEALIARLTHFLAELGSGFAFVGRQYKLTVGNSDYFIDLLFYDLGLRRFIVFELKAVAAQPEHIGKLNFYVNVVDDLLRRPEHGDGFTIGILLAADRDDVAVQYSLRGLTTPLAISTYTNYRALPDEVRPALPGT